MISRSARKWCVLVGLCSFVSLLGSTLGCAKEDDKGVAAETQAAPGKAAATSEATAAAKTSATAAAQGNWGPTVKVPPGTLRAGTSCMDVPRIRPNELEHDAISLGEFEVDLYPYPNEPGKPAKLGMTHDEATKLCAERGKRLCTELEWEYACKGPKNAMYMWGNGFKGGKCDGQTDHMIGQRPDCKTDPGVIDMMGVALEWTSSDWERGTPSGDKVVRGARAEKVSWLSARCTHARKRNPHQTFDNVGFRCCAGKANSAKVVLRQKKDTTLEELTDIDTPFEMMLIKAMPKDHRAITGVELSFDKVYRWHPVANEEMVIGLWKGKPQKGGPFYEVAVFKVCGERAWKAATMRGPVAKVGKPKEGINARKLSFDVRTGADKGTVSLGFWHGTVKLKEPEWVKKGNQLAAKPEPTKLKIRKVEKR
ncbi:MAG: SUMF1/EgtB/PvdO family nonheme iron enzyme [Deltaproteobacteria bacterium]|nr:SUMF1/EgtB/PvdO family nonheme iron enzyme [Deltaproteobacteria bacterium]